MGSGASATAKPTLPWPDGAKAVLYPGAELPEGLSISGPSACSENGISYWQLGGPSKARLRIVEDAGKLLQLGEQFTVAVCCRAGAGAKAGGYDSLLLGDDNKHWLALKGGEGTICGLDASGAAAEVDGKVGEKTWSQLFLRPGPDGGTSVFGVDEEGLLDLGPLSTNLAGSKLRNCGWADNQVEIAAIAVWDRIIPWSELNTAVAPSPPEPAPPEVMPDDPKLTSFRGQVVDLHGKPLSDVRIGWSNGGCMSDKDGCFAGEAVDTTLDDETTVPEEGDSVGSDGSVSTWLSLSFECEGFSPMYSPAGVGTDTSMRVTMRPISASAKFDATIGGNVVDPTSGSSVTMPPNTLVYPDGSEVKGPVFMDLAVIDVTTPEGLASMPGDFSAIGADGSTVMLQSLGAAWIGATDEDGRKLQVKDGSKYTLDLQTEAKANAAKIDTVPEMWSFDEASGKWLLEESEIKINGEAAPNKARPAASSAAAKSEPVQKKAIGGKMKKKGRMKKMEYDPEEDGIVSGCMSPEAFMEQVARDGKKSVAAEVTKLGFINCDLAYHHPQRAVMLQGLVLDSKKEPMVNVQLWASGRDYEGKCPDVTGPDGRFKAMIAQFDSEVDIEVQYRKPSTSDNVVEVFFPKDKRPSKKTARYEDLRQIPGPYKKQKDLENGQPVWLQKWDGKQIKIRWESKRRRWQNLIVSDVTMAEEIMFMLQADDDPGLPFSDGWIPSSGVDSIAPSYTRSYDIFSSMFGPFKTGEPGKFVDVGELETDA